MNKTANKLPRGNTTGLMPTRILLNDPDRGGRTAAMHLISSYNSYNNKLLVLIENLINMIMHSLLGIIKKIITLSCALGH